MGFLENLRRFKDRMTGAAEEQVRTKTFKESADLFQYLFDTMGWDRMLPFGPTNRRGSAGAKNSTDFNLKKYDEDAYIKRGINLHTDFTFGRGIDVPKCKSELIQDEVVNRLWWSSVNQRNFFSFVAQQRRHKETLISGELNILIKIDEKTSNLKLYPINPNDIIEIIPDEDDASRPAFYLIRKTRRRWNKTKNEWEATETKRTLHRAMRYRLFEATPEEMANGLVYHIGLNEFYEYMRGQSDIQTIFDAADSARDMADDGTALSRANAETAYKTEVLKGGKTVKDAYLAYIKTKTDGSNPTAAPASDWVENGAIKREWVQSRDTGAAHRKEDIRAQRAYVWAGAGFGEHYMGDASTGNLATATAMELPVLKMIQAEQKFWASVYGDIVDFAIDVAVVMGKVPGTVYDHDELEVETTENRSYSINFPPILQKDIAATMTALGIAVDRNLIPEKTVARLAMELFEVEDIDEALDELFSDKEVMAELEKLKAKMAAQVTPPQPGTDESAQAVPGAALNPGGGPE